MPIAVFAVIGSDEAGDLNRHVAGLLMGVMVYAYCLCEEIGWRGYLQDAFSGLRVYVWTLLIGVLWFVWHLSFLLNGFTVRSGLTFLSALIFGAWGLGKVVNRTGSLAMAALFHLVVNVVFFDGSVSGGADESAAGGSGSLYGGWVLPDGNLADCKRIPAGNSFGSRF